MAGNGGACFSSTEDDVSSTTPGIHFDSFDSRRKNERPLKL